MKIRKVKESDISQLIELCTLHAAYEKVEFDKTNIKHKGENLARALFDKSPKLFCWVVATDNKLLGYLSATKEFSTWEAEYYIHMDCLYLKKETRGKGLGFGLINTLKEFAAENHCTLIQWQTPEDNQLGISFYDKLDTTWKTKRRYYLEI